ncbi:MAG: hypothetical protein ACE5GV_08050 [Candidatus Scalindua sp.]
MKQYDIEEYETGTGMTPLGEWLLGLKDERAQAMIHVRIRGLLLETLAIGKISKELKEFLRCVNITARAIAYFLL